MRRALLAPTRAASILIALAACGGGSKPAPAAATPVTQSERKVREDDPLARELIGVLRGFKDQACACTDEACDQGVKTAMDQWMKANADKYKAVIPRESWDGEAAVIMLEMFNCSERFAPPPAAAP
jgi:hypothetical protein